jgi:hypothetical protein
MEVYKFNSSVPVDHTLNNTIDTHHEGILRPGQGYLLRANLLSDWETIKITFSTEEDNKQIPLIAFVASKLDNQVYAKLYALDVSEFINIHSCQDGQYCVQYLVICNIYQYFILPRVQLCQKFLLP